MYTNHELCDRLTYSETCLVVEQYQEGVFIRKFHEHVPKHRLSKDGRIHLLRALVIHFSGVGAETILRCYLNERGKTPVANRLRVVTSYPEPGVLRTYCGSDTSAWSDQVIVKEKFRPPPP